MIQTMGNIISLMSYYQQLVDAQAALVAAHNIAENSFEDIPDSLVPAISKVTEAVDEARKTFARVGAVVRQNREAFE